MGVTSLGEQNLESQFGVDPSCKTSKEGGQSRESAWSCRPDMLKGKGLAMQLFVLLHCRV